MDGTSIMVGSEARRKAPITPALLDPPPRAAVASGVAVTGDLERPDVGVPPCPGDPGAVAVAGLEGRGTACPAADSDGPGVPRSPRTSATMPTTISTAAAAAA